MESPGSVVRRYYAYYLTNSNGFFLPVSIIYLRQVRGFGLDDIGFVLAAFLWAEVLAEIPTGYVGDRIGRKASLAVGNLLSAVALISYVLAHTVLGYVVVHVVWAIGWAFHSGTGAAWLYEHLTSRGDEAAYARVSGRANSILLVTSAITAALSGVLVTVDWTLPFVANAALAALGVPILLTLPAAERESDDVLGVRDAVRILRLQIGRPEVRWLVAYSALFYGLFELTRTFEQPAANAVGVPVAGFGLLYAGFKLVSAGAASTAGWFERRLGTRRVFLLLVPVVGAAFASTAVTPLFVVPVLFLSRALGTILRPIRNQYLNDRLADVGRATVLSGASMVLSLVAGGANVVGGQIAEATGPVRFLAGVGLAVAGAAGLLWMATSPVRTEGGTETRRETQTVSD